jgi:deoxycitidine kinase/deoxyguanosine kinase
MSDFKGQIISIEGNIGSGKSTLLENLRNHFQYNSKVLIIKEPIEEWESIKDGEGTNILQKFYKDQEKYAFSFQMLAFISRLVILKKPSLFVLPV